MNDDTVQGKWKQLRGDIKKTFGKLTDDDLLQAEGNADKMIGALQERYGYSRERAQAEWSQFAQGHGERLDDAKADLNAAEADLKSATDHLKDATKR